MKKRYYPFIILIAAAVCLPLASCKKSRLEVMAVTGATPLAFDEDVPSARTLDVTGMVKKEYTFSSRALNAFARTRIRTREVSPEGKFLGTYIYLGIPLFNIMEGVAPEKPEDAVFDSPLDMVVTLTSASGKKVRFSYGELTMTDDRHPVTLAYSRKQLLPFKDPEKYNKNVYREDLTGLRLICPREPDTARYLDNVVSIDLSVPETPVSMLPATKKGIKCSATSLTCVSGTKAAPALYAGVEQQSVSNWVRVGHGRGYKNIVKAEGYGLRSFLKKNFPGCGPEDWYMFVACDGYRCLFSGREIFMTGDGESFMILKSFNGKKPSGSNMLAPVSDYFVDRNIWGLSHVVYLEHK